MSALALSAQSLLNRPPKAGDPYVDAIGADAGALTPFASIERHSVVGESTLPPAVPALGGMICPTAILFGIPGIIIDAIKAKAISVIRLHIGYKICRVVPFLANSNTTPPVRFIGLASGVVAALHHAIPRLVKAVPAETMLVAPRFRKFSPEAPARFGFARSQSRGKHNLGLAAIAHAEPLWPFSRMRSRAFQCYEAAKARPLVYDNLHGVSIMENSLNHKLPGER